MNEDYQFTQSPAQSQPEEASYSTGRTRPHKSHRGIIAFLLVAVIFLCGAITAVSVFNIRLFTATQKNSPERNSLNFSSESTPTLQETPTPVNQEDSVELQLQSSPISVDNVPQTGGLSLQDIYAKTISSVVSISCTTNAGSSTGSGVILSDKGYVVTNSHVIEGARSLSVILHDGTSYPAYLVGADELSDLAVLYVEAAGLAAAEFGDDTALRVGDSVVAIGDPLGLELRGTMTNGIISAINRDIYTGGRTMTLIQTNAALNSGNSGGPLINCYGQVIGINTMKIGDNVNTAGVEGLGFAIPSTTVKEIVDQLITQGYVSGRPDLGISVQQISSFDQMYYRLPAGLYITQVAQDSDAKEKGLVAGDIILAIDDQRITHADQLQQLLYSHSAGDEITVIFWRNGNQYQTTLILGEAN